MSLITDADALTFTKALPAVQDADKRAFMVQKLGEYRDGKVAAGLKPFEPSPADLEANTKRLDGLYGGLDQIHRNLGDEQKTQLDGLLELSDNPDEAKARMVNQAFVAETFPGADSKIMADNWPAVKAAYAKHVLGTDKPDITDVDLYNGIAGQRKQQGAERTMMGGVLAKMADTALMGEGGWMDAYKAMLPGLEKDSGFNPAMRDRYRQMAQQAFGEAQQLRATLKPVADVVLNTLKDAASDRSVAIQGAGLGLTAGEPAKVALEALKSIPADQRPIVYAMIAKQAGPAGEEQAGKKGLATNIQQTVGNMLNDLYRSNRAAFDNAALVSARAFANNADKVQVYGDPLPGESTLDWVQRAGPGARGLVDFAGDVLRGKPAGELRNLTPAEQTALKAQVTDLQDTADIGRQLRDITRGVVDPVVGSNFVTKKILYPGIEMAGPVAQMAVPYAGLPLLINSTIGSATESFNRKGMAPEQAQKLGLVAGAIQAPMVMVSGKMVAGTLPFLKNLITEPVEQTFSALAARAGTLLAVEVGTVNALATAQELTPATTQWLAGKLSAEYPKVDWQAEFKGFGQRRLDTFWAMLPMVALGTGVATFSDAAYGRQYLSNMKLLRAAGFSEEHAKQIIDAPTLEAKQGIVRELWSELTPEHEEHAAQMAHFDDLDAEMQASWREQDAQPGRPSTVRLEDGTYEVRDGDGNPIDIAMTPETALDLMREHERAQSTTLSESVQDMIDFVQQGAEEGSTVEVTGAKKSLRDLIESGEMTEENAQNAIAVAVGLKQLEVGTKPEDVAVFGENVSRYNAKTRYFEDVSKIHDGAHPLTVVEEHAEGYIKRRLEQGDLTTSDLNFWRNAVEGEGEGDRSKRGLIEWFSNMAKGYMVGKVDTVGVPPSLKVFLNKLRDYFKSVLQTAAKLMDMERNGTLPEDFKTHLARATGLDEGWMLRRAQQEEAQAAHKENSAGYTLGDLFKGKKEALKAAGLGERLRLQAPSTAEARGGLSGELKGLRESLPFSWFHKEGLNIEDGLMAQLQSLGFNVKTPDEAIDLVTRAALGEDIVPTGTAAESTFATGPKDKTRDMFDEGLAGEQQFTMDGGSAEDHTGMVDREEARRVAKKKAESDQAEMTFSLAKAAEMPALPVYPNIEDYVFAEIDRTLPKPEQEAQRATLYEEYKKLKADYEAKLAAWVEKAPDAISWQYSFPADPAGTARKSVLSKEPGHPGQWRVSHFDRGFAEPKDQWAAYSHQTRDSKLEAVKEALTSKNLRESKATGLFTGDKANQTFSLAPKTDTPEFKRWFGQSKVVDAEGNPQVVYHGSPDMRFLEEEGGAIFKTQKERYLGGEDEAARAFFFSSSERSAKTYADEHRAWDYQAAKGGIIPVYLSLENPLVIDANGKHWREAQARGKTKTVVDKAKSEGYDGLIIRNVRDDYAHQKHERYGAADVFVAFRSEQIKSADRNRGTFDPKNPDITFNLEHRQALDEIQRIFAPQTRGDQAREAGGILREHGAELAQRTDRAVKYLESAREHMDKMPDRDRWRFVDAVETGAHIENPVLADIAAKFRKILDYKRDEVRKLGTGELEHFIEDYFPHIWANPDEAAKVLKKASVEGSKAFLKEREIPTTAEGIALGLKPADSNPVNLVLLKVREMDKFIMAQRVMKELQAKEMALPVNKGDDAPEGWQPINDKISHFKLTPQSEPTAEPLEGFPPDEVKGKRVQGQFWAPDEVAQIVNNYLSPGLRGSTLFNSYLTIANSLNQFQLGLSAFHLGFTSLDAATSKFALGIEYLVDGNLKEAIKKIAGTPGAPLTNALQGDKVLKEWLKPGSQGAEIAQIVDAMKAAGGRAQMDSFYQTTITRKMLEAFRQGNIFGGVIRAPFAGIELAAKPIMEYIVPRQKLGVFAEMARREMAKLPEGASRDQVRLAMGKAWDSVDNRLGQMVYDNLFWNKVAKDLSMASVRSLGWNLGTLRELGGGAIDTLAAGKALVTGKGKQAEFTHRMAYLIAMPVLTGLMGAITQKLLTGKNPDDIKDYFFPKTGELDPQGREVRLSLPSYMKDVYHYAHDPVGTITGKIHPAIALLVDMLNNKDYFDRPIRNSDDPVMKQVIDSLKHIAAQYEPMGVSNFLKSHQAQTGGLEQAGAFLGVVKAPKWLSMSQAEQLAEKLVQGKMGPMTTPPSKEVLDAKQTAMAKLRNGSQADRQQAVKDIEALVKSGTMTKRQAHNLLVSSQRVFLVDRMQHLDAREAMRVYHLATPEEREALHDLVGNKVTRAQLPPADKIELLKTLESLSKK